MIFADVCKDVIEIKIKMCDTSVFFSICEQHVFQFSFSRFYSSLCSFLISASSCTLSTRAYMLYLAHIFVTNNNLYEREFNKSVH
jgi:hypothetical protein